MPTSMFCTRCGKEYATIGAMLRDECSCGGARGGTPVADALPPEMRKIYDAATTVPSVCAKTLRTALDLTGGDRAKQHGDKRANHQNIADLWNAYFSRNSAAPDGATEWRSPIIFSAHDVAVMMCLLKIARLKSGTHNPDNYIDLCGYAGIAAEIADGQ